MGSSAVWWVGRTTARPAEGLSVPPPPGPSSRRRSSGRSTTTASFSSSCVRPIAPFPILPRIPLTLHRRPSGPGAGPAQSVCHRGSPSDPLGIGYTGRYFRHNIQAPSAPWVFGGCRSIANLELFFLKAEWKLTSMLVFSAPALFPLVHSVTSVFPQIAFEFSVPMPGLASLDPPKGHILYDGIRRRCCFS